MQQNLIKEEISYAYVHAVAAAVGFSVTRGHVDVDSADVVICGHDFIGPGTVIRSPRLEVQLKASARLNLGDDDFAFPLPMKNYNDLRHRRGSPALLVVLLMPNDQSQWISHSEQGLITKNCAYWHNLLGSGPLANTTEKTVRIQRCNHFSPEALRQIMLKISRDEDIGHALE